MKIIFALAGFYFVLILASCSSKPENLIIGKWQEIGSNNTIEFYKDGTVKITGPTGLGKKSGTGTYKFVENSRLKLAGEVEIEVKILVSKDELILADPEGKTWKYRRGKWFD